MIARALLSRRPACPKPCTGKEGRCFLWLLALSLCFKGAQAGPNAALRSEGGAGPAHPRAHSLLSPLALTSGLTPPHLLVTAASAALKGQQERDTASWTGTVCFPPVLLTVYGTFRQNWALRRPQSLCRGDGGSDSSCVTELWAKQVSENTGNAWVRLAYRLNTATASHCQCAPGAGPLPSPLT